MTARSTIFVILCFHLVDGRPGQESGGWKLMVFISFFVTKTEGLVV